MEDKSFLEALKELGRVVILAMIPITVDSLMDNEINFKLIIFTGIIAGLRFLDKLLHEHGKAISKENEDKSKLIGGLTRF